jgi:hypothetical protein
MARLSIIDPVTMTTKTVREQRNTAAVVSADGDYIYLAHGEAIGPGGTWISAIRADGTSAALIPVDSYTIGMALSPGGRRLYVGSASPNSTTAAAP